jgi:hypothetical protein
MTPDEEAREGTLVLSNPSKPPVGWPAALGEDAFHGLVGEFVQVVGPQTEADPAALAIETLVMMGNAVGRGPFFRVGATRHALNEFAVIVGATSRSRKGTTFDHVKTLMARAKPSWVGLAIHGGLSTGEGLMEVCARCPGGQVLFVEDEFGGALRKMKRRGNVLSQVLREAFDGHQLQVSTRGNPILVKEAHVGLLGHTTMDDLDSNLDEPEVFNGLVGRCLWSCARRWKLLPLGGTVADADLNRLGAQLRSALKYAEACGEIELSSKASSLWVRRYPDLSAETGGRLGAATSRAEAHARRLAAIYALLDRSCDVRVQHLRAALEVWRYCRQLHLWASAEEDDGGANPGNAPAIEDRPEP